MNKNAFGHLATVFAVSIALSVGSAQAAVLFQDDFDDDSAVSVLNFNAFDNWNVVEGTVDYIRSGGFGISCAGGAGGCVDVDGSTGNGGRMETSTIFHFDAETTYVLYVDISGNQRGGAADFIDIGFTDFASFGTPVPVDMPWTEFALAVWSGSAWDARIFIETSSNDNVGPVIDNVRLATFELEVPEPATLALSIAALAGLIGSGGARRFMT